MIGVRQLSKRFKLYHRPSDRLKEIVLRRPFHSVHHALRDVTFEVADGETLGILGRNGAGKSTLLKILTGVLLPDAGEIQVRGRITGLLELGTGFDMALTGQQNITGNALLLGMSPEEVEARRGSIVAFSELGDFIAEPLRTYSSGMVMRLAFAIAIHAEPRCFVVDEALSVGDAHFQQKCMRRIRAFREAGGSILFVSHDLNAVKLLCNQVLVLESGRVVAQGNPDYAANFYNRLMARLDEEPAAMAFRDGGQATDYGSREGEIAAAGLRGHHSDSNIVASGEAADLAITVRAHRPLEGVGLGILIRDRFGQDVYGTNTCLMGRPLELAPGEHRFVFRMALNIAPGKYTVTVALHQDENHVGACYHWCDNLVRFEVAGIRGAVFSGLCRLEPEFISL